MIHSLQEVLARVEALPDSSLLTEDEAAAFLRLAKQTLTSDRATQRLGIPYCRMGRAIRYPKGAISLWRNARLVSPVVTA
ncbi:MAG: hypothetical protein ACTHNO_02655 [Ralstonia sp.]|uniref:hypothetical protein n=1 Tax=Ralstonia sp. TaxID=54061 RepID=UPI003F81E8B2